MSRKERLEKARSLAGEFPLPELCQALSVSPSSLKRSVRPEKDLTNLRAVVEVQLALCPGYGIRRMHAHLRRLGVACSREEVGRVYASLGVFLARSKRKGPRTTDSKGVYRYPDLNRGLVLTHPDQIWVADVTHVPVGSGWGYLALLTDGFTRRIVGWTISRKPGLVLVMEALEMALKGGSPGIHHSDGDTCYAAKTYVARLGEVGARVSMTPPSRPQDNGKAERLNRTVKDEEGRLGEYRTVEEARASLERFVHRYNHHRIHQALQWRTPQEALKDWKDQNPTRT